MAIAPLRDIDTNEDRLSEKTDGIALIPQINPLAKRRSHLHLVSPEGQLQVHTAPYRGSFGVVMSAAIRNAGLGSNVLIAQFLKGGVNQGPTKYVQLCGNLKWLRPDMETCLSERITDNQKCLEDANHINAVQSIWKVCQQAILKAEIDQLVLDEIGLAISLGFLNEAEVLGTLQERSDSMDVIVTGPSIPKKIMSMANQITKLRANY